MSRVWITSHFVSAIVVSSWLIGRHTIFSVRITSRNLSWWDGLIMIHIYKARGSSQASIGPILLQHMMIMMMRYFAEGRFLMTCHCHSVVG